MSDETDTTSEVARVLIEHTRIDGIHGDCSCKHVVPLGRSFAAHQADALAEAGLLRTYDLDAECGVCGGTRDRAEVWRRQANRTDYALAEIMPTLRKIFSDATESERQMLDAFDVLIEQARDGKQQAQIATQEPAGEPVARPEGVGTSGTLSGRLRAEAEAGRVGQHARLSAIADEVERTEQARDLYRADANSMLQQKDQWRDAANTAEQRLADLTGRIGFGDGVTEPQADNDTIVKAVNEAMTNSNTLWEVEEQVEQVRALAQWFHDQGQTGYARKVEEALDGTAPEPVSENPFRMPEDRAPVNDWAKVDHTADQCQFEECPSCGCCAHGKEHVIGCSTTLDRPLGTECPNPDCACKGGMG